MEQNCRFLSCFRTYPTIKSGSGGVLYLWNKIVNLYHILEFIRQSKEVQVGLLYLSNKIVNFYHILKLIRQSKVVQVGYCTWYFSSFKNVYSSVSTRQINGNKPDEWNLTFIYIFSYFYCTVQNIKKSLRIYGM